MDAVDVLETLELLGSSQWGLITTAQAAAAGIQRMHLSRLTRHGTLQRIRQGVYALPSAKGGPLQELHAAWLATDTDRTAPERAASADAVVTTGVSAAAVHGVGNLIPTRHEFSSPTRRQSRKNDITYRRRNLSPGQTTTVDGLPVTTVIQTVRDLSDSPIDNDHLATIVRDAYGQPDVTTQALVQALSTRARQQATTPAALLNTLYETAGTPASLADAYTSILPAVARASAVNAATAASVATFYTHLERNMPQIPLEPSTTAAISAHINSVISSGQLEAFTEINRTSLMPKDMLHELFPQATHDLIALMTDAVSRHAVAPNLDHTTDQHPEHPDDDPLDASAEDERR